MKHYYAWNGKSIICNDYPNKKDVMSEISKIIDSEGIYTFTIMIEPKSLSSELLYKVTPK